MVTSVKLRGLNKRQSRGKWYVSLRRTGVSLLAGFEGTKAELDQRLGQADILRAYSFHSRRGTALAYADGTLGALVKWFKDECPTWGKLSDASREDYEKTFAYLDGEMDCPLSAIDTAGLCDVRDAAVKARKTRFADKMVSHLSKIFREGVKRRRADWNPAAGIERVHDADPQANHEWTDAEVSTVLSQAPRPVLTPIVLARFQGFRGQTCQALLWSNYAVDGRTVRAFSLVLRKNDEPGWFPAEPETRAHLESLARTSTSICTNGAGIPWESEKQMQSAVSWFLRSLKAKGLIRKGCTLHGLRVTFAARLRRLGMDTGVVADALGDRSKKMGEHYTRHVEKEVSRLRAFNARSVVQNG